MCGRFSTPDEELTITAFEIKNVIAHYKTTYNAAPSQELPVVVLMDGVRSLASYRWGLIPSWAKDEKIGHKMINARSESLSEKPSFRASFKKQRCVIPVRGFYEWKRDGGSKQAFYIYPKAGSCFALAGLWEKWAPEGQDIVYSFTIVTKEASDAIHPIHTRMPVMLHKGDVNSWLDPELQDKNTLQNIMAKTYKGEIASHPVSNEVNSPKNDRAELIQKV